MTYKRSKGICIFVDENYTRNLRSMCLKNIEEDLTKYTSTNGNVTL